MADFHIQETARSVFARVDMVESVALKELNIDLKALDKTKFTRRFIFQPNGCGEVLRAKTSFQTLTDKVGQPEYKPGRNNDEFIWCYYWIKAPTGSTIEVRFDDYTKHGFCDDRLAGTALNSTFNIVPVITYGRLDRRTTILSYRIGNV
uniref:CUB domain-containing protein n=1 Tax=Angiostrongylus costaricensis TaxID=334426 RepID=A0A0R3Q249_ANGCS